MQVKEIEAKSILVRSKLPDADYVVNPYTGCDFGCQYCYATFTGRFVEQPLNAWGDYVYAKVNAVPVFEAELDKLRRSSRAPSLLLSSVTDPYQALERRYRLTRGILEALAREPYPGVVGILTKSPLVLRDVDLLAVLPRAEVGLTITTTDDRLGRWLEVRAPRASRRLAALAALTTHGISTYAFVGPLLPHFRYEPAALDALFGGLARAGVRSVYVEHLNLSSYIRQRLWRHLSAARPEVQAVYRGADTREHRQALDHLVAELLRAHGLTLRLSRVLHHPCDGLGDRPTDQPDSTKRSSPT
jgi:DNA repair photolyase